MAEATVSAVLEQLTSIIRQEIEQEIRLVVGVRREVDKLKSNFRAVEAVLVDAEQKQVKDRSVKVWLDQLKDTSYEMEDVLDEWSTARLKLEIERGHEINSLVSKKKVCFFFPSPFFHIKQVFLRHDIAQKIKKLNEKVDDIAKQKDDYNLNLVQAVEKSQQRVPNISLVDESEIYGRNDEMNALVSKLLCETSEAKKGLHVISIVGMGGIGKTTLAQLVYNNNDIVRNFEKRIWVSVSDPFDVFRIAKAIIEALEGSASKLTELESLVQHIRDSVQGKKFLLVLDDVWTEDYNNWEPFYQCLKSGHHASKVLITTRKKTVANMVKSNDIMIIKALTENQPWLLFKKIAFSDRNDEECVNLEGIGREIVEKCKGLPLAIKTIGSLLRFKETREEWQFISDSEIWKLEEFEKGIFAPLLLSYNDLEPMVKSCFLYCALFPKDSKIDRDELIHLWMAQGYLESRQNTEREMIGKKYFDILATRSFFQDIERDAYDESKISCTMHDIVHDVASYLSQTHECLMAEGDDFKEPNNDRIYHLNLVSNKVMTARPFPNFNPKLTKLRSLLIDTRFINFKGDPSGYFDKLTCLRALRLSIKVLPKEIGNLIHLRYLDLSCNHDIQELPDALCELYNLQTLKFECCSKLRRLPAGIGKLIKLRHLISDQWSGQWYGLISIPKGIERLTCLQILTLFVISVGDDDSEACTFECLKNLNHLRYLGIKNLGDATNICKDKKVEIFLNKKNLYKLVLGFTGRMADQDHEILLKALQPPPNLESLRIMYYGGNIICPNWIISLSLLKNLTLSNCRNMKYLPPLGKLSYLESLHIEKMHSIERVSNEFLGIESGCVSSSSSKVIISFPKLKSLKFSSMDKWEEWDYQITSDDHEESIRIMPCLLTLEFESCHLLRVLPDDIFQKTTLKVLKVGSSWNSILYKLYRTWFFRREAKCHPHKIN